MTAREKKLVAEIREQRRLSQRAKRLKDRKSYRHHRRQARLLRIQLRKLMRSKRRLSRRDGRLEKRTDRRSARVDRIRLRKGLKAKADVKHAAAKKKKKAAAAARGRGQTQMAANYEEQANILERSAQMLDRQAAAIPDSGPLPGSLPPDLLPTMRFQPRVIQGGGGAPSQGPPQRQEQADQEDAEGADEAGDEAEDAAEEKEDAEDSDTGAADAAMVPFYKKPVVIIGLLAVLGVGGALAFNASKKGKNKSGAHAAH